MILDRVRATIRDHRLLAPATRVVVAVSGGSDSVALAEIACALQQAGECVVAGVAHFNHQLRDTAARDEAFCAALAERLGVSFLSDRGDVAARAVRERRSIEDAARASRYEFFARARAHFRADAVALGHTRDDQAETFLLRLVRGAGPRGLASMYPRHGWIVRPLLDCRRGDLRAYLASLGVSYVEDETNADVTVARNRVRAELLPLLETRFNPAIVDTLAAEADLAREQWGWMSEAAASAHHAEVGPDVQGEVIVDLQRLDGAHEALRRVIVWRAMMAASAGRPIAAAHVAAALRVASGDEARFDAPGHRVEREGARLVLRMRPPGASRSATPANLFSYPLSIPGEVILSEAGCVLSAEAVPAEALSGEMAAAIALAAPGPGAVVRIPDTVALVRRDLCREPLAVRNRRPGDRFRPSRPGPRKKLQDYFVDKKIARAGRDQVPIVVDGEGRIVWVAGHAVDAAFRVTDPAQGVLILRLRQLGGSA